MATTQILLVILVCLQLITDAEPAILQVFPALITASMSFTLNCTVNPSSGISNLFTLELKRQVAGTVQETLGLLNQGGGPVKYGTGITGPKFELTGQIPNSAAVATSYLKMVVNDADCTDEGTYICLTSGFSNGVVESVQATQRVTVEANPKNLTTYTSPPGQTYAANSDITIVCTGDLILTDQRWTWQWRNTSSTVWSPYSNSITHDDLTPTGVQCQSISKSSVKYLVTDIETAVQFRCLAGGREEYSLTTSIYTISTTSTQGWTTPNGQSSSTSRDITDNNASETGKVVAMAIGLSFVVLLVVSVISALIYLTICQKNKAKIRHS